MERIINGPLRSITPPPPNNNPEEISPKDILWLSAKDSEEAIRQITQKWERGRINLDENEWDVRNAPRRPDKWGSATGLADLTAWLGLRTLIWRSPVVLVWVLVWDILYYFGIRVIYLSLLVDILLLTTCHSTQPFQRRYRIFSDISARPWTIR